MVEISKENPLPIRSDIIESSKTPSKSTVALIVCIVAGAAIALISSLVLLGLYFPQLAGVSNFFIFMASPERAVIGIAIGCAVMGVFTAVLIYRLRKRNNQLNPTKNSTAPASQAIENTPVQKTTVVIDQSKEPISLPIARDIFLLIFSTLSSKELSTISSVCKNWKELSSDEILWKKHCQGEGITSKTSSSWKQTYLLEKGVFWFDWIKNSPEKKSFKGSNNNITSFAAFNNVIFTNARQDFITNTMWNTQTLERIDIMHTPEGYIRSRSGTLDSQVFVSTSSAIYELDLQTLISKEISEGIPNFTKFPRECQFEIVKRNQMDVLFYCPEWNFHNNKIVAVDLKNPTVFLGIFVGHDNGITSFQVHEHILISASFDCTIKLWDLSNYTCIKTFSAHTKGVICLETFVHNNKSFIGSGSMDKTINIWDLDSNDPTRSYKTLIGHTEAIIHLEVVGLYLFSSSADKTIRVWDWVNKNCIKTLNCSIQCSKFINFESNFFTWQYSWSGDGLFKVVGTKIIFVRKNKVEVWDFNPKESTPKFRFLSFLK